MKKALITTTIIICTVMVSLYSYGQIAVGFSIKDVEECSPDGAIFGLALWLAIDGVVGAVFWLLVGILAIVTVALAKDEGFGLIFGIGPIVMLTVVKGMWNLAWFIVGCICIDAASRPCLEESPAVYVFSIVTLVLMGLGLCSGCCVSRVKSNN